MRRSVLGALLAAVSVSGQSGQDVKTTSFCNIDDCKDPRALNIDITWAMSEENGCIYGVGPNMVTVMPPTEDAGGQAPNTSCPVTTLAGKAASWWPVDDSLVDSGFRAAGAGCQPWANAARPNDVTLVNVKLNSLQESVGGEYPSCTPDGIMDVYSNVLRMSFYSNDCSVHIQVGVIETVFDASDIGADCATATTTTITTGTTETTGTNNVVRENEMNQRIDKVVGDAVDEHNTGSGSHEAATLPLSIIGVALGAIGCVAGLVVAVKQMSSAKQKSGGALLLP